MAKCRECGADVAGEWCLGCLVPVADAEPVPAAAGEVSMRPGVARWTPAPPWEATADVGDGKGVVDDEGFVGAIDPRPVRRAEPGVIKTAFAAVGLGVVVNLVVAIAAIGGGLERATALRTGVVWTVCFYVVVGALTLRKVRDVSFNPVWTVGDGSVAGLVGVIAGLAMATAVLGLARATTGDVIPDPSVVWLVGELGTAGILAGIVVMVVAAPLVEELLFRGLLAEALQPRSRALALAVSASLFALWHLRLAPVPLLYYGAAGVALGTVYLKYGLKASIASHAVFNICVLVAGVVFVFGPGRVLAADGVRLRAPGGWVEVDRRSGRFPDVPAGAAIELLVEGPGDSGLLVARSPAPPGVPLDANQLLAGMRSAGVVAGLASGAGGGVQPGVVRGPGWEGVHVEGAAGGHQVHMLLVPRTDSVYVVAVVEGPGARGRDDYETVVDHLIFTPRPPA